MSYINLILSFLLSFNCELVFSSEEKLDQDFKNYEWNPIVYGKKSFEKTHANNESIVIYSPLIYQATAKINPLPKRVQEAVDHPGKFFRKDADKAVEDFRKFAKGYKECVGKKKWPNNLECLDKIKICFENENDTYLCNWDSHKIISNCNSLGSAGLKRCFKRSEIAFELFNKCFDDSSQINLTFEIYDKEAVRRKYYVLDSYMHSQESDRESTKCRFAVQNDTEYRLVELANSQFGRPELVMIPLDLWLKDHQEDLLQSQREKKAMKEKLRKSKKPSKK